MNAKQQDFQGRVAVVTGAASGIGRACATLLAAREAAQAIGARAVAIDVGKEASIEAAARQVADTAGPVEVLVHCAGVLQRARCRRTSCRSGNGTS